MAKADWSAIAPRFWTALLNSLKCSPDAMVLDYTITNLSPLVAAIKAKRAYFFVESNGKRYDNIQKKNFAPIASLIGFNCKPNEVKIFFQKCENCTEEGIASKRRKLNTSEDESNKTKEREDNGGLTTVLSGEDDDGENEGGDNE